MNGNLEIIGPDGVAYGERLKAPPDLARLQEIVGGYIELVPHFSCILVGNRWRPCLAFCNEDGKRMRLRPNFCATALWDKAMHHQHPAAGWYEGSPGDYLLGNIAIVFGDKNFMRAMQDDGE